MNCPNCQKNLSESASFCEFCGTKIENQSTKASVTTKNDFPPEVRFLVDMPFEDVKRLRSASRKIIGLGSLAYGGFIIFSFGFIVLLFTCGRSIPLIYLPITFFVAFFSLADGILYCRIRTPFARKVILFKLFWCLLSCVASIFLTCFIHFSIGGIIVPLIFYFVFLSAYEGIKDKKNVSLFGDSAPSYAQLHFFYKRLKKHGNVVATEVPKNNALTKTANFWTVCSLIPTILFILGVIRWIILFFCNFWESI